MQRRELLVALSASLVGCGGGVGARQLIVIDGDSMADQTFPPTTWPLTLAQIAPENDYINVAVQGQPTDTILARQQATLKLAQGRRGWYLLFAGTNDIRSGVCVDVAWSNINALWSGMAALGYRILATTVGPLSLDRAEQEPARQEFNNRVRQSKAWAALLDVAYIFPSAASPAYADQIHFSPEGNAIVAHTIKVTLENLTTTD